MWWAIDRIRELVERSRRRTSLRKLSLLSDHLLDDLGLRRDQLDSLGSAPTKAPKTKAGFAPRRTARPSLQGCG